MDYFLIFPVAPGPFTIVMALVINAPELRDRYNVYGNDNAEFVNSVTKLRMRKIVRKNSSNKERRVLNNSDAISNANNRDLFSAFGIKEILTNVLPTFHRKFFTELKLPRTRISGENRSSYKMNFAEKFFIKYLTKLHSRSNSIVTN